MDEFRELIEAYALGALDPEDRAAVAAHLATGCPECTKALGESQWLVSQLAYLAPEAAPSDMLRGRLLKTVREEVASSKTPARKSAIELWMWAALTASVVFAVYNVGGDLRQRAAIRETEAQLKMQSVLQRKLQEQLAMARREAMILTDPKSMKIPMPAGDKEMPGLQATWHHSLGIVVTGQKLPMPSGNHTLQLWLIPKTPGAKPMPSMTLRPEADGNFEMLVQNPPDSPDAIKALAITEEPEGGSSQPTTPAIWVGAVPGK